MPRSRCHAPMDTSPWDGLGSQNSWNEGFQAHWVECWCFYVPTDGLLLQPFNQHCLAMPRYMPRYVSRCPPSLTESVPARAQPTVAGRLSGVLYWSVFLNFNQVSQTPTANLPIRWANRASKTRIDPHAWVDCADLEITRFVQHYLCECFGWLLRESRRVIATISRAIVLFFQQLIATIRFSIPHYLPLAPKITPTTSKVFIMRKNRNGDPDALKTNLATRTLWE